MVQLQHAQDIFFPFTKFESITVKNNFKSVESYLQGDCKCSCWADMKIKFNIK